MKGLTTLLTLQQASLVVAGLSLCLSVLNVASSVAARRYTSRSWVVPSEYRAAPPVRRLKYAWFATGKAGSALASAVMFALLSKYDPEVTPFDLRSMVAVLTIVTYSLLASGVWFFGCLLLSGMVVESPGTRSHGRTGA